MQAPFLVFFLFFLTDRNYSTTFLANSVRNNSGIDHRSSKASKPSLE